MTVDLDKLLGPYGATLVLSYNPQNYERLTTLRGRDLVKFAWLTLLWSAIIFTVAFLFMSISYITTLPAKLDTVDTFELSGTLETEHEVLLVNEPAVSIAPPDTESKSLITITREGVQYPQYILFGKTFVDWETLKDIKQHSAERNEILKGLMIFILPSVLFWFFLIGLFKLGLLLIALLIIGHYLPRAFKQRISFQQTFKSALLAMPSAAIIGVGFTPFGFELFWWGALLTTVIYGLAIALLSERQIQYKKQRRAKRRRKSSKKKN